MAVLTDKFGRAITDLRISVTDRCNYKCVYCRTGNEGALYGELRFEDYLRMTRVMVSLGITKIRLTGGEPLLRRGIVDFVRELAKLRPQGLKPQPIKPAFGTAEAVPFRESHGLKPESRTALDAALKAPLSHDELKLYDNQAPHGDAKLHDEKAPLYDGEEQFDHDATSPNYQSTSLDLAITTNGHLLADMAQPLKEAGLNRITVSMDAVDPDRFSRITRVPGGFDHVLAGVRAARHAGLWPLKVNCVLMRGFNEDQIISFGMFAREEGVIVRFIEFMPLEEERVWSPSIVVTLDEILERMAEYRPLVEIPHAKSETARRYRFDDGVGEIGIIAPVSHPFCGHCSRIRITSDGKIRTCLFSIWDHDLHELMRRGASDDDLAEFIVDVVQRKEARHHIGEPDFVPASRTMVHIGG
jgi:cyclic pyranopterin phosphate synthase